MNISKLYAVGSLWLLVCAFALSNNQSVAMERSFVSQADEFRDAPPVSHLTVEGHFQPTIMHEEPEKDCFPVCLTRSVSNLPNQIADNSVVYFGRILSASLSVKTPLP